MSLLRDLEKKLESLFEGFFTKQFRSGLQPIELAHKLAREMEAGRTIGVSKTYAPNDFTIWVSPPDKNRLGAFEDELVRELSDFVVAQSHKEGLELIARPTVAILARRGLTLGQVNVTAKLSSPDQAEDAAPGAARHPAAAPEPATPGPGLAPASASAPDAQPPAEPPPKSLSEPPGSHTEILNVRDIDELHFDFDPRAADAELVMKGGEIAFALTSRATTIGRANENDIVLSDPNISRQHAELERKSGNFLIRDLSSTNGTLVNGQRIQTTWLSDGDTITLGGIELVFRRIVV